MLDREVKEIVKNALKRTSCHWRRSKCHPVGSGIKYREKEIDQGIKILQDVLESTFA